MNREEILATLTGEILPKEKMVHDLVNERNDEDAAAILVMLKTASAEMSKINATLDELLAPTKCTVVRTDTGEPYTVTLSRQVKDTMLYGSNIQPGLIEIKGEQVQLGTVVAGAQARSFMTPEEWNGLPNELREDLIAYHIEWLRCQESTQEFEVKPALLPAITVPLKNAKAIPSAYNPNSTTHIIPK